MEAFYVGLLLALALALASLGGYGLYRLIRGQA
jgi:hypothetical protein